MIVQLPLAARARRAGALWAGVIAVALFTCGAARAAAATATPMPPSVSARSHPGATDRAYATRLPAGRFGTVTVYIPEAEPAQRRDFPLR